MLQVAYKYRCQPLYKEIAASYGSFLCSSSPCEIENELVQRYGFSPVTTRLYHQWLVELVARLGTTSLVAGDMIFLAISADE